MNAIEFIAQQEDGIIKIPSKYRENLTKKFRVIILVEEKKVIAKKSFKRKFSAVKINTKGFKFDREEAHER